MERDDPDPDGASSDERAALPVEAVSGAPQGRGVGGAILIESALSFLGLGVQPPTPSWGSLLSSGKDNIEIAWWLSVFPGLAILITVLGYNLLGEGIRDALDPRQRE